MTPIEALAALAAVAALTRKITMTHEPAPLATLAPGGAPLDVVAVVSNPARYESRYRLYRDFAEHMAQSGVRLTTVESQLGERPFRVTDPDNPRHLQVRRDDQIWDKESLINYGVRHLPRDWKYVAWIDADVTFARPDWALETLHQLQVHPVVQLFSHAIDLGPKGEPIQQHKGFGFAHQSSGLPGEAADWTRYEFWHPGFAWAMTRKAFDALGGLLDISGLGAADHHMATSLVGRPLDSVHGGVSDGYKAAVLAWADRAKALRGDVGYVPGLLLHHWHGKKRERFYQERWGTLIRHAFDPTADVHRDGDGLARLGLDKPGLRDDIRRYFLARNEDSVDRE